MVLNVERQWRWWRWRRRWHNRENHNKTCMYAFDRRNTMTCKLATRRNCQRHFTTKALDRFYHAKYENFPYDSDLWSASKWAMSQQQIPRMIFFCQSIVEPSVFIKTLEFIRKPPPMNSVWRHIFESHWKLFTPDRGQLSRFLQISKNWAYTKQLGVGQLEKIHTLSIWKPF